MMNYRHPTTAKQRDALRQTGLECEITSLAHEAASEFVDEFPGQAIAPTCDWDSESWQLSIEGLDLTPDEAEHYWPIFSAAMHAEIARLNRL